MSLVDDIELYGRAADTGEMSGEEAILMLMAKHPGSLTRVGAASSIANWQSARSEYEQVRESSARGLRRMDALRGITEQ